MKSLKEYIAEGLLDRVKNKEVNHEAIIKQFLEENYKFRGSYTIKAANNKFIVDVKGAAEVTNKNITSLTNGLFEFGVVSSDFCCPYCESLKTLEGAPKHCRLFYCHFCSSLRTLEGIPKSCMFASCSKLNYIKAMFTTIPSSSYTNNWVSGVASSGTFVKNKNATWNTFGEYAIPSGWTVQTA